MTNIKISPLEFKSTEGKIKCKQFLKFDEMKIKLKTRLMYFEQQHFDLISTDKTKWLKDTKHSWNRNRMIRNL